MKQIYKIIGMITLILYALSQNAIVHLLSVMVILGIILNKEDRTQ